MPSNLPLPPFSMTPTHRPKFLEALLGLILVVVVLYFGRDFLVLIALSILFSFLLAPLVSQMERWRLGRIGSVILTTICAFAVIGGLGTIVAGQLIDLANDLPKYQGHLHQKIMAIKAPHNSPLTRATQTLQELTKDLAAPAAPAPTAATADGRSVPSPSTARPTDPIPVKLVADSANPFTTIHTVMGPLIGPLGDTALVIVFVIFMLLEKEELRDRIIHLIGKGHLRVTTEALDEAASRVSRYLVAQCIVNLSYGLPIGIGLYFIGIPNSFLWGLLAAILRFIPYIGAWISAAFPILLSLAITDGWTKPLETVALFVVVELVCANVVEPWLYGASTGLSAMAVIVSAAFWTWLWGMVGLLLATPLTVCIVVLGKYIPALSYIDVLLGDKPPISPEDRFYQRLLAMDDDEVSSIAENYRKKHGLADTFDLLLVPALLLADKDFHEGSLHETTRDKIHEILRDVITDLDDEHKENATTASKASPIAACVAASDFGDELVGHMLAKLLAQTGHNLAIAPSKFLASEMLEWVEESHTRLIAVSVLPPGSSRHAIYVCKRLRERFEDSRIVVGMWGESRGASPRLARFRQVRTDGLVTSLQEMVKDLLATGATLAPAPEPAALPAAAQPARASA